MANYQKTPNDLKEDLDDQIGFLKSSCQAFDAGTMAEAKRMAVHLRIMLLDNGRNANSLLSQLGIKDKIEYLSVLPYLPNQHDLVMASGLMMVIKGGIITLRPNLSMPQYKLSFEQWWNQVINKSTTATITRAVLIKSVANMDGGAHIDPVLRGDYATFSREDGYGWESKGGPIGERPELMLVRQIVHEVLYTLNAQLPNLLP